MMTSKDDRSTNTRTHHVRPIANRKELVHLQKSPPHDRSCCRRHVSAFRNLLETHPDIAERISKLPKRKSPVYGREGRAPICESHREMCMALRAKGLTNSDYPFSTRTLGRSALKRFVYEIRYGNFQKKSSDRPKSTIAGAGNLSTTRKVLGSTERGRRPFVVFMGVRYTGLYLAQTPSLIGRKVILSIHRNNLQTIAAFSENGQFFDVLEPSSPKWRVPHSYEFRKQVLKRCRQAYVPKEIL